MAGQGRVPIGIWVGRVDGWGGRVGTGALNLVAWVGGWLDLVREGEGEGGGSERDTYVNPWYWIDLGFSGFFSSWCSF